MVAVLAGERTALDFLMVLSGIATEARRWQQAAGESLAVCDTRKTWPGFGRCRSTRSAWVVRPTIAWGCSIWCSSRTTTDGSPAVCREAVARARQEHPELLVEIEADDVADAVAAVEAGADLVLLDNMDDGLLASAVRACREASGRRGRHVLLEASGNVTFERLASLRTLGLDRVSASAITLANPLDLGLDEG